MKCLTDDLEKNPNNNFLNLSDHTLSQDEIDILKLGLKHGLATRPNTLEMMAISEDLWEQDNRLNAWKDGIFVKDKAKNTIRSFTFSYCLRCVA